MKEEEPGINPEGVMLSQISQTEKDKDGELTCRWNLGKNTRLIDTENR